MFYRVLLRLHDFLRVFRLIWLCVTISLFCMGRNFLFGLGRRVFQDIPVSLRFPASSSRFLTPRRHSFWNSCGCAQKQTDSTPLPRNLLARNPMRYFLLPCFTILLLQHYFTSYGAILLPVALLNRRFILRKFFQIAFPRKAGVQRSW